MHIRVAGSKAYQRWDGFSQCLKMLGIAMSILKHRFCFEQNQWKKKKWKKSKRDEKKREEKGGEGEKKGEKRKKIGDWKF